MQRKKVTAHFESKEKMIGHRTRLRKNEDLPLWGAPILKKKSPCFKEYAPITREVMRSKDAQYRNNLKVAWGTTPQPVCCLFFGLQDCVFKCLRVALS